MNSDSEEDFEVTYEADDEDEDGDVGVEAAAENVVVPFAVSQPMDVPPFMRNLDIDVMHAPKFLEYANIGVANPEDGEFRIGMEYIGRRSNVYESEPLTFYAKCKTYGRGCDWLIRAILIRKKVVGRYADIMVGTRAPWEEFHKIIPSWTQIRNIGSNFLRAFKVSYLQKLVVNIGYSTTVDEYNINYQRLQERGVRKMPNRKVVVDLARWTCNCKHFQLYVNDVYKMTEVRKVYRFEFVPLGNPETWPVRDRHWLLTPPCGERRKVAPN
ncbi:hypothetical protein Ahy_A10g047942 [Arachis hypogaea]|uniref:Transposase MuDR plant domain-containing protein n=1 Tax=Arachis hypogaea TaxID=3818 RepID=A0A445B3U7_ARAHY|nr:hypothetical protein Ahy_A10g047942 [Arachis hypogaea]